MHYNISMPSLFTKIAFILIFLSLSFSWDSAQGASLSIDPPHKNIELFYNSFNRDTIDLVEQFYDPNVHFVDPIVELKNRDDLKAYYKEMYEGVKSISFKFTDEIVEGDQHVVLWQMTMSAKKLNRGKPIVIEGVSHIRFGGDEHKAIYHRDYFDIGAMVYEHVPVIGRLTRYVKKKLKGNLGKKE